MDIHPYSSSREGKHNRFWQQVYGRCLRLSKKFLFRSHGADKTIVSPTGEGGEEGKLWFQTEPLLLKHTDLHQFPMGGQELQALQHKWINHHQNCFQVTELISTGLVEIPITGLGKHSHCWSKHKGHIPYALVSVLHLPEIPQSPHSKAWVSLPWCSAFCTQTHESQPKKL